jgi:acetyl-CoA carboxylase carboxyl transferase subunit beta
MVDMVVPRGELRDTVIRIVDLLRHPTPPAEVVSLPVPAGGDGHAQPRID